MELLEKLTATLDGTVEVLFQPRQVFFRWAGGALCARLLDGPFPPWRKALLSEPRYRLVLPVGPFLCGVRQATVLRESPYDPDNLESRA